MQTNSTPQRGRTERRCEQCGRTFRARNSDIARGKGRYCGASCRKEATGGADYFWSRVDKSGECWVWTGGTIGGGYGRFSAAKILAHRHAWALTNGPVPDGLDVLHRCDNPPCVRPDHLFLGTHTENMRDMTSKGRRAAMRGAESPNARQTDDVRAHAASSRAVAHCPTRCTRRVRRARRRTYLARVAHTWEQYLERPRWKGTSSRPQCWQITRPSCACLGGTRR